MQSTRKLPVVYPIVASNTEHGYLLSGVQSNNQSKKWIMGNYIEQVCYSLRFGLDMNFYPLMNHSHCPCIDYLRISRDFIQKKWKNILEFIMDCIDSKYYIIMNLDLYYIPKSVEFQKLHISHPTLIYGYNNITSQYYVADFYENSKFSFTELSYDAIERSFLSHLKMDMPFINERYFCAYDAITFKNRTDYIYDFDISFLKKKFENYLNSTNLSELYNLQDFSYFKNSTFGIDTLNRVCEYIKFELTDKKINYKFFTVPHERTNLMIERLKYLYENNYLESIDRTACDFAEISNEYKKLINLTIKYNITRDKAILVRIQQYLLVVRNKELSAFSYLIDNI